MKINRVVALAISLTFAPAGSGRPGPDGSGAERGSWTQELVDHLKELIRGAEQDRR